MAFSASESAFEGFRIIRREPLTIAVWAVILLVVSAAVSAVMLPALSGFTAGIKPGGGTSPAQLAALGNLMWMYLGALPIELVVLSVFTAAIYRAVLRPEDKALARLRFGGDELRLMALYLLLGLFFLAVFIGVDIVAALLAGGVIAATRSAGPGASVLIVMILFAAMIAAWAWLGVKFSFAAPMTFSQKRIRMFASWGATKGRFWPLLGCYLLAGVFVILVMLVDLVVSGVLAVGLSGGSLSRAATSMFRPNVSSAMSLLSPIYVVRLIVGAAFGAVMWTVGFVPAASAYREIAGPKPQDQADTFA